MLNEWQRNVHTNENKGKKKPKHKLGNRTNRWSKTQADSRFTSSKKQRKTYPQVTQSE